MPGNRALDSDSLKEFEANAAGNKEYIRQVERIWNHFQTFTREVEKIELDLELIAENTEDFENLVKKFFYSLTVDEVEIDAMSGRKLKTGKTIPPTIGYARNIKSTLFKSIASKLKVFAYV